jgi:uracil-DNA glycosylase
MSATEARVRTTSCPPIGDTLEHVHRELTACRACPRLVRWREQVARVKRKAYLDWDYWGRPVPGFGDPRAAMAIVGLAPAAHGANRTGRPFTGDASGDFLYPALHRAGFANQPRGTDREDGLRLTGVYILSVARCAPPANRPSPAELRRCAPFLDRELALLKVRLLLALGAIAWEGVLRHFERRGIALPRPLPRFAHGAEVSLPGAPVLLGSYHVSRQNTQTGKLTRAMFDAVLARAKALSATAW